MYTKTFSGSRQKKSGFNYEAGISFCVSVVIILTLSQ